MIYEQSLNIIQQLQNENEFEWKYDYTKKKSVFLNQKHALQRNYDFNTLSQKWEYIYARPGDHIFIQVQIYTFTLLFELMKHMIFWKEIVFFCFQYVFIWMKTRSKLRKSLNHIDKR
jgi:hypothetical protein